jgi:solute:Na+ symporter, SSS family
MALIDWAILVGTLLFIVVYGVYKTKGSKNISSYLKGDNEMKWYTIGLSIMATQASAITFLSVPGQAFEDGMSFVQFYFGMPLAIVIICITILPIYYKLKVYTAYEYLEGRFDLKTRLFTASLFLLQRGLAAGITIYAPAIILSSLLGLSLNLMNVLIGTLVIIYTVSGGTKAVSQTQKQQMVVILAGMVFAFVITVMYLPDGVGVSEAMSLAGVAGKMNIINTDFDTTTRYTIWSGLTGGLFLSLSYFGTDQSQVQRYLSGKSLTESRLGLIFNGLLKIPMQFFILLTGIMVFVFYQFNDSPLFFNKSLEDKVLKTEFAEKYNDISEKNNQLNVLISEESNAYFEALKNEDEAAKQFHGEKFKNLHLQKKELRTAAKQTISQALPNEETKDTDYIFITYILNYLPVGVIGLLLAVIFSAAMSSTAGELNALASTTVIDFYQRIYKKDASDEHYLKISKWFTLLWGMMAILFATLASLVDNLIQAVNILGSIFYGTILGIFMVAFYLKKIGNNAVFIAGIIAQITVLILYFTSNIGFLWFNVIGCLLVVILSVLIQKKIKIELN